MTFRFCDEQLGTAGFGWIVDEPMTRTSHALVSDGRVWLVDPLDWPDAIERARGLGEPAGVIQLLDRHTRDCALLADRLGVPRHVVPLAIPGSPFELVSLVDRRVWRETALWWAAARTLVVAEVLGSNRFYTGGKAALGVQVVLRLTPPTTLASFEPDHVLVGHGEGSHTPEAAYELSEALRTSRRGLPGLLMRLPLAGRGQ